MPSKGKLYLHFFLSAIQIVTAYFVCSFFVSFLFGEGWGYLWRVGDTFGALIPKKVRQLSGELLTSSSSPNFHQTSVNRLACD